MKHTIQEDNWREEFKNQWKCEHSDCGGGGICQRDRILEMFETLFASQLQSIKDEIETMKQTDYSQMNDDHIYDEALSDVQSIISNRMGEKI